MPSLHVAFAALVALFIASRLHSRWRWLLALYPVAMGATLVYTGEHYVLDLLAGIAYALGRARRLRGVGAATGRRRAARGADGGRPAAASRGAEAGTCRHERVTRRPLSDLVCLGHLFLVWSA